MTVPKNEKSTKTPFFSVVIPCYERPEDLRRCLQSLSRENQKEAPSYEIIVTDDSRSEDCQKVVELDFPHASWGQGKQNGPGGNRNAGVERAKGEWIVFIDDDCLAEPDYLEAYSKAIKNHPEVSLFEGKIFPDRPKRTWAETCPENSSGGMFWTSNLCIKKKVFEKLGGFDERFEIAYEDVDLAYRVKEARIKTLFVETASACHPWRTLRRKGNNWKPKGFELQELLLFLDKHPDSKEEHGSPKVYLRHACRMLSKDLLTCLFQCKARGIDILLAQFLTTCTTVILVITNSWKNARKDDLGSSL